MRKITLGVAALVVMALAIPAGAGKADHFTAHLTELNDSGVTGQAVLWMTDDALTVNLTVNGLDKGLVHMQHIHGKPGIDVGCPTVEDAGSDGFLTLAEGGAVYGLPLLNIFEDGVFPTANNGGVTKTNNSYEMTDGPQNRDMPISTLAPLENRVVVIHGLDLDGGGYVAGSAEFTTPVACGVIVAQP